MAALDERDKDGVLRAQKAENQELKRRRRECEQALDITEKLLQEFRERDRRHADWTPDDALASFFDNLGMAARRYFSFHWWWQKLRKYSAVWMTFRFFTRVAWWMSQAAWWQIVLLFMMCGNLFVVILNLLLVAFRIVDDTVSISGRVLLLIRLSLKHPLYSKLRSHKGTLINLSKSRGALERTNKQELIGEPAMPLIDLRKEKMWRIRRISQGVWLGL